MRYPVAIEPATESTCFGVVMPDLPRCFSARDMLDEAMTAAENQPRPGSTRPSMPASRFGLITVNAALLDDTIERVNITLPRRVLLRLDALVRSAGETRSGYIANQVTLEAPRRTAD